ncbi:hypothetical protein J2T21_004170 [Paeniglutamicibacter psychrophenolicus]|nr:hypothetical protein [Paeniglutamicibacter psychrophenolicus]
MSFSPPQMSLTSRSSLPCSASMRATSAATASGSRWSTATAMPTPPAAVTSSAVRSMVSGRSYSLRAARVLRPVQYTVAPASPSATAMPRPAPRVAPATRAIFPASVRSMASR